VTKFTIDRKISLSRDPSSVGVVDASGGSSVMGFDFEEVFNGEA
jgi:hypothetical protein